MTNRLDVVTIGTDDERPIVVRVVLRTKTRCTIVFATRLESSAIEFLNLFATFGGALSALLFLYRDVLEEDLPWLTDINRPTQVRCITSVLTKDAVAGLLAIQQ